MSLTSIAILITLAAAFSGWLQSGSAMPMVLSLLILLTSFTTSVLLGRASLAVRTIGCDLTPWLITGIALYLEIRHHRSGLVFDSSTSLPIVYHIGIGLLWWLSSDLIFRSAAVTRVMRNHHALVGIAGGLLLISASAANGERLLNPWLLLPVAALPLATCAAKALLPSLTSFKSLVLTILSATIAVSALIIATTAAADAARFASHSERPPDSSATRRVSSSDEDSQDALPRASRRLPRDADIRFTGKVMVHLRAHSPDLFQAWKTAPLYVRTSSLALFESDEVISAIRSGRWIYDLDDGNEDNSITLEQLDAPTGSLYTAYVSRLSATHLPVLITSTTLYASAVYEFADDWYQLTPPDNVTHLQYKGSATTPRTLDESRRPDLNNLRQWNAPSVYLNHPPSPLSSRIRELAAGLNQSDPLDSIRTYLSRNASYSLKFSTPEDSSPVEEFLFGSRKGHCEHYAAATVLLLRSLGIPSRIAYGYAGGAADSRQRIIAFRDNDFHAWAEIMSPDQNDWIIFDTTPSVSGAAPKPPTPANLPMMDETVYHNFSRTNTDAVFAHEGINERIATIIGLLSQHFLAATLIGLVFITILSRILTRQRRLNASWLPNSTRTESLLSFRPRFIDELVTTAQALGVQHMPGHTLKELIVGISRHRPLPVGLDSAVSYYYSVSYCGHDPDPAAEKYYLTLIRQWSHETRSD